MAVRVFKTILLVAAVSVLASCGYHFNGEGAGPKPGLKSIAIPVFINKTSEPNAGAIFADALRQEFMQKGNMCVVTVEDAEAVFRGTISNIFIQPVAHHAVNQVDNRITVENRLVVVVDIRCEDKETHKVLWRDPALQYHKIYKVEGTPLAPNPIEGYENREAALRVIAKEISSRIHDRFLSNF